MFGINTNLLKAAYGAAGDVANVTARAACATAGAIGGAAQATASATAYAAAATFDAAKRGACAAPGYLGAGAKVVAHETGFEFLAAKGAALAAGAIVNPIDENPSVAVNPNGDKEIQSDDVIEKVLLSSPEETPALDKTAVIDKQKQIFRDYSRLRTLYFMGDFAFKYLFGTPLEEKNHEDFCKMLQELKNKGALEVLSDNVPVDSKFKKALLSSIFWFVNYILDTAGYDEVMNDAVESGYEELSDLMTNQDKRINFIHALVQNLTDALQAHDNELEQFIGEAPAKSYNEHFTAFIESDNNNTILKEQVLKDLSTYVIEKIINKNKKNHGKLADIFINGNLLSILPNKFSDWLSPKVSACLLPEVLPEILKNVFENVFEFLMPKDHQTDTRAVNPEFVQNMNGLVLDVLTPKPAENEALAPADETEEAKQARGAKEAKEKAAADVRAQAVHQAFINDVTQLAQQLIETTLPTATHAKTAGTLNDRQVFLAHNKEGVVAGTKDWAVQKAHGYALDLIKNNIAHLATTEINPDKYLTLLFEQLNKTYRYESPEEKANLIQRYLSEKQELSEAVKRLETPDLDPADKETLKKDIKTRLSVLKTLQGNLPHNEYTKEEWGKIYATTTKALNKAIVKKEKAAAIDSLGETYGEAALAMGAPVINYANDQYVKGALATMVDPVMMARAAKAGLSALVKPVQKEAE